MKSRKIRRILLVVGTAIFVTCIPMWILIPVELIIMFSVRDHWKNTGEISGEFLALQYLSVFIWILGVTAALMYHGRVDPLLSLLIAIGTWIGIHYGIHKPWLL